MNAKIYATLATIVAIWCVTIIPAIIFFKLLEFSTQYYTQPVEFNSASWLEQHHEQYNCFPKPPGHWARFNCVDGGDGFIKMQMEFDTARRSFYYDHPPQLHSQYPANLDYWIPLLTELVIIAALA